MMTVSFYNRSTYEVHWLMYTDNFITNRLFNCVEQKMRLHY